MSTQRTRTSSEVKWLANELAMLAGEIEKVDAEMTRLQARRESLAAKHASLAAVAALVSVPQLPDLVPPVQAHPPYGGRGNLRNFVRDVLRAAYPGALDSRTLGELAVNHFWDTFDSDLERQQFRRKRVPHTLRKLIALGEVERLHACNTNAVGGWRWKVDEPTMVDLMAMRADLVRA